MAKQDLVMIKSRRYTEGLVGVSEECDKLDKIPRMDSFSLDLFLRPKKKKKLPQTFLPGKVF